MSHKHRNDEAEEDDQDLDFKGNRSPLKKDKTPKTKERQEDEPTEREEKLVKVKDVKLVKGKTPQYQESFEDSVPKESVQPTDYLVVSQENKIKELHKKIIDLESEIQELTSRVSKSNNQELQNKINDLENQLTNTKDEILKHNKQVQGFMEEGIRSIRNQKDQIDNSQNILEQIKDEMIMQHHLIKKRDELVEKAHLEVEENTQIATQTKIKNVELEYEIEKLLTKIERMHEERKHFETVVADEQTKCDQIYKKNLLIDELNKDMLEMNIEDLWKFVNQSLYEWVHGIRRSNIKEIVKVGDQVLDTLKDQGLTQPVQEIESIMRQFEFLRDKPKPSSKDQEKDKNKEESNKPDETHNKPKENVDTVALKKQKDKEDKEKARFKRMVENAKKYNPVLKRLMNISQHKAKGKDGN